MIRCEKDELEGLTRIVCNMFSLTFIGGNNIGVKKIAILGAGVMGAGIAQAAVHGGYEVIIRDLQMTLVQKGLSTIYNSLKEKVQAHEITNEELELMKSRLTGTTDLTLIHDADMVIEAIIENASVKKQVFAELDNHCREDTILGTNTSTLSISEIASATKNPQQVIVYTLLSSPGHGIG